MGGRLRAGKPSRCVTSHLGRLSLLSLQGRPVNRVPACLAGVRPGELTCVGWKVPLCDPIWQVTPRSSEMTCHEELYRLTLTLTLTNYGCTAVIFVVAEAGFRPPKATYSHCSLASHSRSSFTTGSSSASLAAVTSGVTSASVSSHSQSRRPTTTSSLLAAAANINDQVSALL